MFVNLSDLEAMEKVARLMQMSKEDEPITIMRTKDGWSVARTWTEKKHLGGMDGE